MDTESIDRRAWSARLGEAFQRRYPAASDPRVDRLSVHSMGEASDLWRARVRWREPGGAGEAELGIRVVRAAPAPPGEAAAGATSTAPASAANGAVLSIGATVPATLVRPVGAAAALRSEVDALDRAGAAGVPAPTVWLDGTGQAPAYLAFEWLAGEPFSIAWRRRRAGATPDHLAELLTTIHQVAANERRPARSRALDRLRQDLVATADAWPGLAAAADALGARLPEARAETLCHGGFRPEHVLLGRRDTSVVGWSRGHVGDPRLDLARTSRRLLDDYGPVLRSPFLRAYRRAISVDPTELAWFEAVVVLDQIVTLASRAAAAEEGSTRLALQIAALGEWLSQTLGVSVRPEVPTMQI